MNKLRARSESERQIRREKLLDSAKKLFSINGYQTTTIKMITKEASLSPAAFYLYFKSKIELYRTLNLIGIDILEKMITDSIRNTPMESIDKISAITHAYCRFFLEEGGYYNIIAVNHLGQREFFQNTDMVQILEEGTRRILSLIASAIREGAESGEFRRVDPHKTAATLWGMIDGVLIMEVKKSTDYLEVGILERIDHLIDLLRSGLVQERKHQHRY